MPRIYSKTLRFRQKPVSQHHVAAGTRGREVSLDGCLEFYLGSSKLATGLRQIHVTVDVLPGIRQGPAVGFRRQAIALEDRGSVTGTVQRQKRGKLSEV